MQELVIGTRGSALALWQAEHVKMLLEEAVDGLTARLEIIHTTGDKILDTSLSAIGDKGLFTKELEQALLEKRIDLAVHSLKDLPTNLPDGLTISAITRRARVEDALVAPAGTTIDTLPDGATVATGSLRRRAQLLQLRPDLDVVDVRGNVPTRLKKYRDNGWSGMILASAGLERLGLSEEIAQIIPLSQMLPAVGQGALGIETRIDDERTNAFMKSIEHLPTRITTTAERAMLRALEGGCQVPIGAYATLDGDRLRLDGVIASLDGTTVLRDSIEGTASDAELLGTTLAGALYDRGGEEILVGIRGGRSED